MREYVSDEAQVCSQRSGRATSALAQRMFNSHNARNNVKRGNQPEWLEIVEHAYVLKNLLFPRQSFTGSQSRSFRRRGTCQRKSPTPAPPAIYQHRPQLHRSGVANSRQVKQGATTNPQNTDRPPNHGTVPASIKNCSRMSPRQPRPSACAHDLWCALVTTHQPNVHEFPMRQPPANQAIAIVTHKK